MFIQVNKNLLRLQRSVSEHLVKRDAIPEETTGTNAAHLLPCISVAHDK